MAAEAGSHLLEFNDFSQAMGDVSTHGPKGWQNDAVDNTYWWGRSAKDRIANQKLLNGGRRIRSNIAFEDNGTFGSYLPGQFEEWKNPQRMQRIVTDWRFTRVHKSWDDAEITLNEVVKHGTDGARAQKFLEIYDEREGLMQVSKWNGLEGQLFAVPSAATMGPGDATETDRGVDPYSLFFWINEGTNGLYEAVVGTPTFTSKGGLVPSAYLDARTGASRWAPQTRTYNTALSDVTAATPSTGGNIITGLDLLFDDLSFERPMSHKQYWESTSLQSYMVITSKAGKNVYKGLLRSHNDRLIAGPQDPAYQNPQFAGVSVGYSDHLDTAAVYAYTGNPNVTEMDTNADNIGPRFYCWNSKHLYPIVNEDRRDYRYPISAHHNVQDRYVQACVTWWQLHCDSMWRQGLLSPSGDIYTAVG